MRADREVVEEIPLQRPPVPEPEAEPEPLTQLPSSNAVAREPESADRVNPASVAQLQRLVGNQAVSRFLDPGDRGRPAQESVDVLTEDGADEGGGEYLDQVRAGEAGALGVARQDGGAATATTAPPASGSSGTAAPPAAVPTNLRQILTSWAPGPTKYGFQLKFQCSSSSGSVADLQAQAPNLVWREYVTYSRNDFSHRINPPNPTILPPGGVSFAAAATTVISPNLLEFNTARDTHWMPTSAVRAGDFQPVGSRPLPAIMQSRQLYQYSTDGSTWTDFAGPFTLTRTLERAAGPPTEDGAVPLVFTTDKAGIHSVTEQYKP